MQNMCIVEMMYILHMTQNGKSDKKKYTATHVLAATRASDNKELSRGRLQRD